MKPKFKKITDFFNPISNPAGGMPTAMANSTKPSLQNPVPLQGPMASGPTLATSMIPSLSNIYRGKNPPPGPQSQLPFGAVPSTTLSMKQSAVPVPSAAPTAPMPVAPTTMPPAAPTNTPIPPQYLNPDGSKKTPEQVAADLVNTLKKTQGNPDIGTLAGNQFGGANKTAQELQAEAALINNARNDIAVGENDPYKVASQSGIAYTAAELQAIEKAYAGIYDPAINTALAKVEAKQAQDVAAAEAKTRQDEMRLQATLDAQAPFTLGEDQVRYGPDGKPLAVGLSSDPTGGNIGVYTPGANPTVDSFIKGIRTGTYKPSDVPDEYKALVSQGMAATQPQISESSREAVSIISELLGHEALNSIAGVPSAGILWPGTPAQEALTLSRQLKGMLSLENREQLKGSGAISDFEFKVLGQAASALGINDSGRSSLSNEDFNYQLQKLQLKLEVGPTELTDDELIYLRDSGYTPEEIRQLSEQQSFNSVGNTTASATGTGNRPQRNNNPGNVKRGGLSDALAVGTDDQGHLIFPDAATGFQAMRADITAKINGGSKWLPANPTISQLGKVYAEDPNWPKSVARILGVSTDTPTKNIPIDQLVQAIATQEGFFA